MYDEYRRESPPDSGLLPVITSGNYRVGDDLESARFSKS
jgi:hypothetical protein